MRVRLMPRSPSIEQRTVRVFSLGPDGAVGEPTEGVGSVEVTYRENVVDATVEFPAGMPRGRILGSLGWRFVEEVDGVPVVGEGRVLGRCSGLSFDDVLSESGECWPDAHRVAAQADEELAAWDEFIRSLQRKERG